MNRPTRILVLVATMLAVTACSVGGAPSPTISPTAVPPPSPSASAAPTAMPSPTPRPTPVATAEPTADPTTFAAAGIGPYVVGATLADLQARGLVADVADSVNCDASWQGAAATGPYAGQLYMTFHLGRLVDVATQSTELETPSGARVGMSLTELQAIYGDAGTVITGTAGNQALSVRVPNSALGIVFFLDESNTTAVAMAAGEVERLEIAVEVGEGC